MLGVRSLLDIILNVKGDYHKRNSLPIVPELEVEGLVRSQDSCPKCLYTTIPGSRSLVKVCSDPFILSDPIRRPKILTISSRSQELI